MIIKKKENKIPVKRKTFNRKKLRILFIKQCYIFITRLKCIAEGISVMTITNEKKYCFAKWFLIF